jgi:hypothetical protein
MPRSNWVAIGAKADMRGYRAPTDWGAPDPLRSCAAKFAVMQTTSPHWNNYVVGFRSPLEGRP